MAVSFQGGSGVDLEKELSCSICTDVLYQPLTLLDCLHTFCGSCLKEWFKWQATSTHTTRTASPYTCPSCRATVRAARPNANVTTLLDMFLSANPDKGKSEEEKAEMRRHFKPGDDVLPRVEVEIESEDSEEERLVQEARQLSIAESMEGNRRVPRGTRARSNRESADPGHSDAVERNVAHQPSLRSLLSASGEDSAEVQQEILESILSSGILDGIDIDNLTHEQEEELAARIAELYRRRHRPRDHHRDSPTSRSQVTHENASTTSTAPSRNRQANSRPHLIDQWTQDTGHNNRRSTATSEHRRRDHSSSRPAAATPASSATPVLSATPASSATSVPSAARSTSATPASSATSVPSAARSTSATTVSPPNARSVTDPVSRRTERNDAADSERRQRPTSRSNTESSPSLPYPMRDQEPTAGRTAIATIPHGESQRTLPYPDAIPHLTAPHEQITTQQASFTHRPAPLVTCDHCNAQNLQFELHYHCHKCNNGNFDICLQCYRAGRGCKHWFGFGYNAMMQWQRNAQPPDTGYELPHTLMPRRYTQGGAKALLEGAFCEICSEYTDESYWHCSSCFQGAWGYCSSCVRKGKHCTHPLTLVARIQIEEQARQVESGALRPMPLPHLPPNSYYFLQTRSACDICGCNIPWSNTRFHCNQCRGGDYDICNNSYSDLVAAGKISTADGPTGRRRCLHGHPMSILTFRSLDHDIQQRCVVQDPVGGWQAQQGSIVSVPEGSSPGLRCLVLWSWFPAPGVQDELSLPKFAEVTEVEQLNADYYLGVYAGSRGLFPANHVRLIDT